MTMLTMSSFANIIKPTQLIGPIFDKELRISSRRKRNYFLRFAYLILLTVFVVSSWIGVVNYQRISVYQISRMSVAGTTIITTIIFFQFIATQLIAVIMLSNSISDEVYHRTLGVLMTTPINSFQIVMGKLFSKILQIILLVSISLPLLSIVRIFGGVPWEYLISSLCITLTSIIFAGVLSLNFSISNKRAYVVIIKTVFTLGILYFFIPMLIVSLFTQSWFYMFAWGNPINTYPLWTAPLILLNPIAVMAINTTMMLSPMTGIPSFSWPLHCVLMLALSAILLARSVKVVRRIGLCQATGTVNLKPGNKQTNKANTNKSIANGSESSGTIKQVKGSPVLWKELRMPMIQGPDNRNSIIGFGIAVISLLITYTVFRKDRYLAEDFTHIMYALMFVITGSIFNMIFASTCITSEKESQTWPILLSTPMSGWQIIFGKALGVFYRCLPVWILFAGHILLFVFTGTFHPIAILHFLIFLTGIIIFLTGLGIYCGSRVNRTTWSVVLNFIFIIVFWAVIPIISEGLFITSRERIFEFCASTNPIVQVMIIMRIAVSNSYGFISLSQLRFSWAIGNIIPTTGLLLFVMTINIITGLFCAWRANCRLRRNIF
ncbi:ABC transporter permease [Planctomycetota bacterium]